MSATIGNKGTVADATAKPSIERILRPAGIQINGPQPWDIRINDERAYARLLGGGSLGIGESYMDGWWDCPRLDELACRVLAHDLLSRLDSDWRTAWAMLKLRWRNLQATRDNSAKVARVHYDLGNDFYEHVLGPSMVYSCAYWREAANLEEAQEHKLDLICRKLELKRWHRLLDVGCGWGALARHAAGNYGCSVTGITNSEQQFHYATEICKGLPVAILRADYRDEAVHRLGPFDRITVIGMFEHVGKKNYRSFMRRVHDLLKEDGAWLLQVIGSDGRSVDPWIDRYIFPNSALPSVFDLAQAVRGLFTLRDWHSFGADYDKTLMAWYDNFERFAHSRELPGGDTFSRMWRYYLLTFAGCFRASDCMQLWQLVLARKGAANGYVSVR